MKEKSIFPQKKTPKRAFSVRLSEEARTLIKEAAEKAGISQALIVESCVMDKLSKAES